ncbi:hypothetical protein [Candidatus Viridilinea mediisalina]|uniref:Uncharacterized protein n=1 Tax=Candidatus Viridilinea mediisalina TaxID=2024553 RepID=A0A2A6RPD4_9CHLR|nr:hypothetical protein [Candidatus Viridilinea mediisalina]PDW04710.1 hypothetical protein CJ255_02095 [Candidatus Viridilinea mediisalina]
MLIVLDPSLIDLIRSSPAIHLDAVSALENIAQARRAGKNLVFADHDTLAFLKSYQEISAPARDVFANLYRRRPQSKSLLDGMAWHVRVVAGVDELRIIRDGNNIISVSFQYFADNPVLSSKITLLTENSLDGKVFEQIARYYLYSKSLGHVRLAYDPHGGGGQTTGDEFANIQQAKDRLCLCIVDSDRQIPNGSLGSTAKYLLDKRDSTLPFCHIHVLPVRELENIMPIELYRRLADKDVNRRDMFNNLKKMRELGLIDAIKYIDVKKGMRLFDLRCKNQNDSKYKFWSHIFSSLELQIECYSNKICEKREHCECTVIAGMGDKTLEVTLKALEQIRDADLKELMEDYCQAYWDELGSLFVSWCCVGSRMNTI